MNLSLDETLEQLESIIFNEGQQNLIRSLLQDILSSNQLGYNKQSILRFIGIAADTFENPATDPLSITITQKIVEIQQGYPKDNLTEWQKVTDSVIWWLTNRSVYYGPDDTDSLMKDRVISLKLCEQLIATCPNNYEASYWSSIFAEYSNCALDLGEYRQDEELLALAVELRRKCLTMYESNPLPDHWNRGFLVARGKVNLAEASLAVYEFNPTNHTNELEEALGYLEQAINSLELSGTDFARNYAFNLYEKYESLHT